MASVTALMGLHPARRMASMELSDDTSSTLSLPLMIGLLFPRCRRVVGRSTADSPASGEAFPAERLYPPPLRNWGPRGPLMLLLATRPESVA